MKANELRIGNFLEYFIEDKFEGNEWVLNKVDGADIFQCETDSDSFNKYYRPIPLTPEVLEKCGFNDFNEIWIEDMYGNDVVLQYDFGDKDLQVGGNWYKCQYLHQLQNLYFALTGEELEYKP